MNSISVLRGLTLLVLLPLGIFSLAGFWLVEDRTSVGFPGILDMARVSLPHWGPMLFVSLGATWFAHGGRDTLAGLRFVAGMSEENLVGARRSLATAARSVVLVGVALGIFPFLRMANELSALGHASPAELARSISQIMLLPMGLITLGRIAFASAADQASILLGEPRRRVFQTWQDLALFILLPTTGTALMSIVVRF